MEEKQQSSAMNELVECATGLLNWNHQKPSASTRRRVKDGKMEADAQTAA
ncbi:unnamed protein product [marine sediment metagenome]|uniref:Uncharacterized protein n=1 Tax=marine sediment metagenome TaxID=412755 RepID=X1G643_9ZZZZ